MSASKSLRCDVAIAGGGMVGLSLAAALAELPLDVVVVEPVAPGADEQPSFDSRTTALSGGSRRVLEGIGAWAAVAAGATPIRRIHVSERGAFGTTLLTAEEQGVASLGYTVENRLLGQSLRARVGAFPRIRICNARVATVAAGADAIRIATDGGEALEARLVVAADGAQSAVRAALGIDAAVSDYGQQAVIAHVDTARFHDYTAFERFMPAGPVAVLPIGEGRSAIVWTLAPDAARRALTLDDRTFLAELQSAFGLRLGRFTRVGRRQAYPLALTQAERLTAPRAVILGNAAQCLHPVAGQGFNLALRDVALLAELLADAGDGDPGDPALLERYAAERAPDRDAVIRFTDSLVRGFGLPLAPLRRARGHGLLAFDLLRPVKREFARRTMGLAGRQPRLVRGLPLLDPRGMKRDFDIIVVGGAMAGAGATALLAATPATAGLRVALVEPRPATAPAAGTPLDIRVSAVSRASQQLLERTGAWESVAARAAAYRRMVIWEMRQKANGPDALVFDAAELGEPDLGHIGENRTIQAALTARAEALGVVLLGADFATLEATRDAVRVGLGDGREFRAGLVVGADGAESAVRRAAGIETRGWDYGQRAVVAHLECERPHAATAWQRFLDTGPLALLPLGDGRVSLVWSTLPEEAESLVQCTEAEFSDRVTMASDSVLGRLVPASPRAAFPLRLLHARRYAAERVALVGDAAHVVHPLAGQGINLAFLDAAALVDVVGQAVAAGDDPGELAVLRRYERWRKADALPAIALLDGIKRLFFGGNPLQSRLRQGMLGLAQSSGTVKRLLMQRALGVAGGVPASVRRPPS